MTSERRNGSAAAVEVGAQTTCPDCGSRDRAASGHIEHDQWCWGNCDDNGCFLVVCTHPRHEGAGTIPKDPAPPVRSPTVGATSGSPIAQKQKMPRRQGR